MLDPKVEGTLILTDVLTEATANDKQHEALDFIALFSSVSSLSALPGRWITSRPTLFSTHSPPAGAM